MASSCPCFPGHAPANMDAGSELPHADGAWNPLMYYAETPQFRGPRKAYDTANRVGFVHEDWNRVRLMTRVESGSAVGEAGPEYQLMADDAGSVEA